jgi:hypothetical protein
MRVSLEVRSLTEETYDGIYYEDYKNDITVLVMFIKFFIDTCRIYMYTNNFHSKNIHNGRDSRTGAPLALQHI